MMDGSLNDLFSNYFILIKPSKYAEKQVFQTFECSAEWFMQALGLLVQKPEPCKTCSKLKIVAATQTEMIKQSDVDTQTLIRKHKSKFTSTDEIKIVPKVEKATMTPKEPKKECRSTMTKPMPNVSAVKPNVANVKPVRKPTTKPTVPRTSSISVQTDTCDLVKPLKNEKLSAMSTTDNNSRSSANALSRPNINSCNENECGAVFLQSELDKLPKNVSKLFIDCYLCCRMSKLKFTTPLRYVWGYLKLLQHFINTANGVASGTRQLLLRWAWHVQCLIEDLEYRPAPHAIMFDQCVREWANKLGGWSFMEARANAKFDFTKVRRQQEEFAPEIHNNEEPTKDPHCLKPQPVPGSETNQNFCDQYDRDKLQKSLSEPVGQIASLVPVIRSIKRDNMFDNERDTNNKRWKTSR